MKLLAPSFIVEIIARNNLETYTLVQRHILVLSAFEHLKKYEILGSRILDVMRKRLLYVANLAFLEIHGTGALP
jgi:hypothetical protein